MTPEQLIETTRATTRLWAAVHSVEGLPLHDESVFSRDEITSLDRLYDDLSAIALRLEDALKKEIDRG